MTRFATIRLVGRLLGTERLNFQLFASDTHIQVLGLEYKLYDDGRLDMASLCVGEVSIEDAPNTTKLSLCVWKPEPFDRTVCLTYCFK